MIKAIIFDFDYTLGDCTDGIVQCVNFALHKLAREEKDRESIKKTVGMSLKRTFAVLTGSNSESDACLFEQYFLEKAADVMVKCAELYNHVQEILRELKADGYKLGVVTTKGHAKIEGIMAKFDLTKTMDILVGGDDVKIQKPSPEGLLWTIEQLEVDTEEVLYVGDSLVDAETAKNANVKFLGVLTGTTTKEDFATFPYEFLGKDMVDIRNYIISTDMTEC